MPKSFIYSVRNYRNRKTVEVEEEPISGQFFPSRILTRSGKVTDHKGNVVPWHIGDHYHHYYQHYYHQSLVKVRGSLAGNGSTAKDRERKRRAKAKPKSLHHLSLVTRFQLGLRMSRLRSRQWPSCPVSGHCRVPAINGIEGKESNRGLSEAAVEYNNNVKRNSCDVHKGEAASLPLSELSVDDSLVKSGPAENDETMVTSKEAQGTCSLQSGDRDTVGAKSKQTRNSPCVSGIKEERYTVSKDDTLIQCESEDIGQEHMDFQPSYVAKLGQVSRHEFEPRYSTQGEESWSMFSTDIDNSPDKDDRILPTGDTKLTDEPTRKDSPAFLMQSRLVDTQRPKIVITLHGTKPCNSERRHASHKTTPTSTTDAPACRRRVPVSSLDKTPDEIKTDGAQTNALRSGNESVCPRPCQLMHTQPMDTCSQGTTDSGDTVTSKSVQTPEITTIEDMDSNLEASVNKHTSVRKVAIAVDPKTLDYNRGDQPCVNVAKLPKGNIVFVVKPNVNDETERKRLQSLYVPFPKGSDIYNGDEEQTKLSSAHVSIPGRAEKYYMTRINPDPEPTRILGDHHQIHTTHNTEKDVQTDMTLRQEMPTLEDWKQRKIIIAYNKMVWKPNFENKDNDVFSATSKLPSEKQETFTKMESNEDALNDERDAIPFREFSSQPNWNTTGGLEEHDPDRMCRHKEMASIQSNTGSLCLSQTPNASDTNTQQNGAQYDTREEFRRISALYNQELCDKSSNAASDLGLIQQDNKASGEISDFARHVTPRSYNEIPSSSDIDRDQPFPNMTTFERTSKMAVETSFYDKKASSGSSNNPMFTQMTMNPRLCNDHMTEEHPNLTNASQVVLVPSSNVFTVTPSDIQYNARGNTAIKRDNSNVTWSNHQMNIPQNQQHQRINNASLSNGHTTGPLSKNGKTENDCIQRVSDLNASNPLREISNCVVNHPCEYKIPIRKESIVEDNGFRCVSSIMKCVNFFNDKSEANSLNLCKSLHYFNSKDLQRDVTENDMPKTITESSGSSHNSSKIVSPLIENFIGWVPVRLNKGNESVQKPVLFLPTQGMNLNVLNHVAMTSDSEPANKTNQINSIPSIADHSAAQSKSSSTAFNCGPVVPNSSHDHRSNVLIIRSVEDATSTRNIRVSNNNVPVQLSWFPMATKAETTNEASVATCSFDFGTKYQQYHHQQQQQHDAIAFSIQKTQGSQFLNQIRESKKLVSENQDGINFATPAADLLSSVAKVPVQSHIKNSQNGRHGTLFRDDTAEMKTTKDRLLSIIENAGNIPRLNELTKQDEHDINHSVHPCFTQSSSSGEIDYVDDPSMANRGLASGWFEPSKTKIHENQYEVCSNLVYPNISGNSSKQMQLNNNIISKSTAVGTKDMCGVPLLLLRDRSRDESADKMSSGEYEYKFKHACDPIQTASSLPSPSVVQSVNSSRSCPSELPLIPGFCGVKSLKQTSSTGDRPTQIYIANPFAGGQIHPSAIQRIVAHHTPLQETDDITENCSKECDQAAETRRNSATSTQIDLNSMFGGHTFYVRSDTMGKPRADESKNTIENLPWKGNLVSQHASSFPGAGIVPVLGQHQNGILAYSNASTRCEISHNNILGLDLQPQISTMSLSSLSTTPTSYTSSFSNVNSSSNSTINNNNNVNNNNVSNNNSSNNNMNVNNVCLICHRRFTRPWLLKGHMRTHTGERPFMCSFPLCEKAFADKSNLRSHMQTHTAITKNFECDRCGRAFSQKRYLHKHITEVCKYGNK